MNSIYTFDTIFASFLESLGNRDYEVIIAPKKLGYIILSHAHWYGVRWQIELIDHEFKPNSVIFDVILRLSCVITSPGYNDISFHINTTLTENIKTQLITSLENRIDDILPYDIYNMSGGNFFNTYSVLETDNNKTGCSLYYEAQWHDLMQNIEKGYVKSFIFNIDQIRDAKTLWPEQ